MQENVAHHAFSLGAHVQHVNVVDVVVASGECGCVHCTGRDTMVTAVAKLAWLSTWSDTIGIDLDEHVR